MAKSDKPGVFISYSQHDEPMMRQLVAHLSMLEADLWHDRKLVAGDRWAEELDERLDSAEIVLLVVSHNFLSSKFCMKIELPRAVERERKGETRIIPVIVSDCDWENAPFSQFQILPINRNAIESWEKQNEAFKDVVRGIRQTIAEIRPQPGQFQVELTAQPKWRMPKKDLPYLCDRSDQKNKLEEKLREHRQSKNTRPIICLIHGDEREAHDQFLKRVNHHFLPTLLGTGGSGKHHVIEAPRRDEFWGRIADAMIGDSSTTKDEIWHRIARHEEPLMFSLSLPTDEFGERCEELVESLLAFCDKWDHLPAGRAVIHCVSLKYGAADKIGWLDFKKKRRQQLDNRLREKLSSMDFSNYPNLTGIVLPELKAIRRSDVHVWSQRHHPLTDKEIRALFDQKELCNEDGHIPMETLAEKLAEKLKNKED